MKLIRRKTIPLPVSDVWRIVSDPEQMPAWNLNCVLVTASPGAPETRQFEALFKMKQKERQAKGQVIHWRMTEEVTYRYSYEDPFPGTVEETFRLQQDGGHVTQLVHEVDFSESGLPWWARLLMVYIGRFGRLVGEDSLNGIERRAKQV